MSIDPTCGCCEGIGPVTPRTIHNRPGLNAIATRIGTHPDFFATMIARLTSHELPGGTRPLHRLTTRDPDDPSIALLDAWAVVSDVLTFYQERIANEGYLETATQRRSVLELGRLVGYRLRPGVAASVYLAFALEEGYEVTIPAGTLSRSLPEPGENAEPFETSHALEARDRWGTMTPRLSQPQALFPISGFEGVREVYLEGTSTGLEAGQIMLITGPGHRLAYEVRTVEADAEALLTRVEYADKEVLHVPSASEIVVRGSTGPLEQLGDVVSALRKPPSEQPASRFQLGRDPARTYQASADLGPQLMAELNPAIRGSLFAAYANAPVTGSRPEDRLGVEALRVSATPFGATAPLDFIYLEDGEVQRREWPLAETRSNLSVEASVDAGGPPVLAGAFAQNVDLDAGQAAPISLAIHIWDPMIALPELSIRLSELADEGAVSAGRQQALDIDVAGVPVRVEAQYTGPLSATTEFRLSEIRVIWGTDAGARTISISAATIGIAHAPVLAAVVVPNSGISVSIDGVTDFVFAGQPPVQVEVAQDRRATLAMNATGTVLTVSRQDTGFAGTPTAAQVLSLDAEYDGIVPGGLLLIDHPTEGCRIFEVLAARNAARSDYGVAQSVTHVLLDQAWLSGREATLADIRGLKIQAGNEALPLGQAPLTSDVSGSEIQLNGLYEGLEAGRWLAITGDRTDILSADGQIVPEVEATELAMIAGVAHRPAQITGPNGNVINLPGDTLHTRLTLAEPLAYSYKRETVALNANVVLATHGETVSETIGSGDSAVRLQTFALAHGPVTHVSAPTPSGAQNTLSVRVNDILWHENETLLALDADERGYQSRTDNKDTTSVTFGDGLRGARLPSGSENVRASYRVGIGAPGNVGAGQISTLGSKPLGVKEVSNPRAASGGADRESRDQARRRVPLATRALDRLVSVEDYTDFSVLYAGIDKAHAARLSDGGRDVVHVTLAGAGDAPIDPQSSLYRNLKTALAEFGDPSVPVVLAAREAAYLFLSAKVSAHPDHLWEDVEPPLRAVLLERFGFAARDLGQPLRLSAVISAMQAVPGVNYVDVDLFEAVGERDAETPETLAARLAEFAARPPGAPVNPYIGAGLAQRENGSIRPAQLVFLNGNLPDTLILTEVTT